MEAVRWCEGGGDARRDSGRRGRGDRSWEKLREGERFGARGEKGGRMSAKKAIYIRQKTVPLALTATSWHHHPLLTMSASVDTHIHTRVNSSPRSAYSNSTIIPYSHFSFKTTCSRVARTWRDMKFTNLFFDSLLLSSRCTHTHTRECIKTSQTHAYWIWVLERVKSDYTIT